MICIGRSRLIGDVSDRCIGTNRETSVNIFSPKKYLLPALAKNHTAETKNQVLSVFQGHIKHLFVFFVRIFWNLLHDNIVIHDMVEMQTT